MLESDRPTPVRPETASEHESTGTHPIQQRVESQWPRSLFGLVLVVVVVGVVKFASSPQRSVADGTTVVVGTATSNLDEDLRVVAELAVGEHRVELLEGDGVPLLIAVRSSDGRALGLYESLEQATGSYPEIDVPALGREVAIQLHRNASR